MISERRCCAACAAGQGRARPPARTVAQAAKAQRDGASLWGGRCGRARSSARWECLRPALQGSHS